MGPPDRKKGAAVSTPQRPELHADEPKQDHHALRAARLQAGATYDSWQPADRRNVWDFARRTWKWRGLDDAHAAHFRRVLERMRGLVTRNGGAR